jgi:hypothetical protein
MGSDSGKINELSESDTKSTLMIFSFDGVEKPSRLLMTENESSLMELAIGFSCLNFLEF